MAPNAPKYSSAQCHHEVGGLLVYTFLQGDDPHKRKYENDIHTTLLSGYRVLIAEESALLDYEILILDDINVSTYYRRIGGQ
uniref:Uncharacterized protein n=1 Tax=Oryza nivara TaxID=4536 RepID=A0A0E0FYA9_ORYNI